MFHYEIKGKDSPPGTSPFPTQLARVESYGRSSPGESRGWKERVSLQRIGANIPEPQYDGIHSFLWSHIAQPSD